MNFRQTLACHFHELVHIERYAIFGAADVDCMPINLPDDSATMFAGYVGKKYQPGQGLLLLAINPGGGGDKYKERTKEDKKFYPLLCAFKHSREREVSNAFERVNESFVPIVQRWNLWRILGPTLDAAGRTIDEVAYMNVVPYRTRGDKTPPIAARRSSWRLVVDPTVGLLDPAGIVTLGKKAGSVVEKLLTWDKDYFCVPRTIGDSWVSDDALAVHQQMRAALV